MEWPAGGARGRRAGAIVLAGALLVALAPSASGLPAPAPTPTRKADKVLYLTFDDGPVAGRTPQLLRVLAAHDATATFFLVGGMAEGHPRLVRRIARAGHAIGNHTQSHARLTDLSRPQVRRQLRWATEAIGPSMGPCMRPPYGLINARVRREATQQGLTPVMWNGHIEDWATHSVAWHVGQLKRYTRPGAIILLHDRNIRTIRAVRRMLPVWQEMGYRLESLPACRR